MARNILWLGAHKTGTTFLQKSLDLSQDALAAGQVHYVELDAFRQMYTRPLVNGRTDMEVSESVYRQDWEGTNLVFDENLPALVQHVCRPEGLYTSGPARSRLLADHLGFERPLIVFGIRAFASYLPSLYCETLKSTPFKVFRKFLRTPLDHLAWYPAIKALQGEFQGSDVLVYQYETLKGNERALLAHVTGLAPADFTLLGKTERLGFSHRSIRALRDINQSRKVERKDVRNAVKRFPKSAEHPAYWPWKPEEKPQLAALYAADVARIKTDDSLTFLDCNTL